MADLCDFRELHECACPAGSCQQTPAPLHTPSKRFTAIVITYGAFMAVMGYVALSEADKSFHRQQIEQQEASFQWK